MWIKLLMHVDKLTDTHRRQPGVIDYLKGTRRNREDEEIDEVGRRPCKVLEDSAVQTYLKIERTPKEN